jgi:branched-chain amino acid transport system permease protein
VAKAGNQPKRQIERIPLVELALLACFLPLPFYAADYVTIYATRMVILCFLALSFDMAWGFAGVISFGQAVFYGGAGYVGAILARDLGVTSIFLLIPAGAVAGTIGALLIGFLLLTGESSRKMIFVGLGTLICSYAAERIGRGWAFLGGQNGIPSLPMATAGNTDLTEGTAYFYVALALLCVTYLALRAVTRSQLGLALTAMRENETRIAYFGYRTAWLKIAIFTLSGAVAGVGGVLAVFHDGFVAPPSVGVVLSTQAVLYVLLGGAGTRIGGILGVIVIEGVSFWLSDNYSQIWPILLALLLLLIVLARPSGLISLIVSDGERAGSFGTRLWRRQ